MDNIVNLTTKKLEITAHALGATYKLYAWRKSNKLLKLELEVTKGEDITLYILEHGDSSDMLFIPVPQEIEKRIKELLA